MEDSTQNGRGPTPDRTVTPSALADILAAHEIAARLVESALELHVKMPDTAAARAAIGPLVTHAGEIEASVVDDLRILLDGEMTPADVIAVVAHADRLYHVRPRLGRFVDRLLMASLARRAGLTA